MSTSSTVYLGAIGTLLVALLGCGNDSRVGRVDISGRVTFRDSPVPKGQIEFIPDAHPGDRTLAGFAIIEQGEFNTAQGGRSVGIGAQRVRIRGFDGNSSPADELLYGRPLFTYETTIITNPDTRQYDFTVTQ